MNSKSHAFSNKDYSRFLKNELEDIILTPPTGSSLIKIQAPQETCIQEPHSSSQKQIQIKYKPLPQGQFDYVFYSKNKKILASFFSCLALSEVLTMMKTCKRIRNLFSGIWKLLIEKKLNIVLPEVDAYSNPSFMRTLYSSLHFSLSPNSILSSRSLLNGTFKKVKISTKEVDLKVLTYHLMDFQEITSLNSLVELKSFSYEVVHPILMLSFEPETQRVTLWLAGQKEKAPVVIVLFKYECEEAKKILSAKLHTEKFLVIQTYEDSGEEEKIIEIQVIKTPPMFSRSENSSASQFPPLKLLFQPKYNQCAKILTQNGFVAQFSAHPPDDAFSVVSTKDRLFFYTTHRSPFIFAFNIQTHQIETVYQVYSYNPLTNLAVFENSQDSKNVSIFLVQVNGEVIAMEYDTSTLFYKTLTFSLPYVNPYTNNTKIYDVQDSQSGSYPNHKGEIQDYLIVFQNDSFFYIDPTSQTARKIVQIIPASNETKPYNDYKDPVGVISGKKVSAWCVYEDLLAILLDNQFICVYKFALEGEFVRLTLNDQRFLTYKYDTGFSTKRVECSYKFASDLNSLDKAPVLYMNHSYLIAVTGGEEPNIHITSLQGILAPKDRGSPDPIWNPVSIADLFEPSPEIRRIPGILDWETVFQIQRKKNTDEVDTCLGFGDLNIHKANWRVITENKGVNPERSELFDPLYVGEKVHDVKIQGNSILLFRRDFNIFMNLQSQRNFLSSVPKQKLHLSKTDFVVSVIDDFEVLKKSTFVEKLKEAQFEKVPSRKNPNIALRDNPNHVEKEETKKDSFDEEEETEKDKKKKRKDMIKKLINPKTEVQEFYPLPKKEVNSTAEFFLRKINKQKDDEKGKRRDQRRSKQELY